MELGTIKYNLEWGNHQRTMTAKFGSYWHSSFRGDD